MQASLFKAHFYGRGVDPYFTAICFFYDLKKNLFKELDRVVPRKHTVECEDCEDVEKKKCKVEYWDFEQIIH